MLPISETSLPKWVEKIVLKGNTLLGGAPSENA
jgi:hypothetical protein